MSLNADSGVPRILEWRGWRRQGGWGVGRGYTFPTRKRSGEGAVPIFYVPPPQNFFLVFFVENSIY